MAKQNNQKNDEKKSKPIRIPVISTIFITLMKMISISLLAGFVCLLIEIGMYVMSPDNGSQPARDRLTGSLENISDKSGWFEADKWLVKLEDTGSGYVADAVEYVNRFLGNASGYLKDSVGYSQNGRFDVMKGSVKTVGDVSNVWSTVLSIWYISTLTYISKMLSLIAMMPSFLLILSVGIADSICIRGIDTFRGKRTSQDMMEYWHYAFYSFFYLVPFLFIAIPNTYSAYLFVIPCAVISSFLLRQTLSEYKKYI